MGPVCIMTNAATPWSKRSCWSVRPKLLFFHTNWKLNYFVVQFKTFYSHSITHGHSIEPSPKCFGVPTATSMYLPNIKLNGIYVYVPPQFPFLHLYQLVTATEACTVSSAIHLVKMVDWTGNIYHPKYYTKCAFLK